MIKYVKGDVSIRNSLNKNVSQICTGVTLTPWYRSRVKMILPSSTPACERTRTRTISGFSIHDVRGIDLIRYCELPEDGSVLAPKHVGAAITF
jgi:hypothetical protein